MKNYWLLLVLLLGGCASSERMLRMSGDVVQEYSAPLSLRLQSTKWQSYASEVKPKAPVALQAMDNSLINIWPFFFQSAKYASVMWPFIDWDSYGFAVRPFYNKEGDEHAILFPLSAWSSVNGDGWVGNFYWSPNSVGLFPFFMKKWDNSTPVTLGRDRVKTNFNEFMLYYYGETKKKLSPYDWFDRNRYNVARAWEMGERLNGSGYKVPQNQDEYSKLVAKLRKDATIYRGKYYGFFPFFSYEKSDPKDYDFSILGPFGGMYEHREKESVNLEYKRQNNYFSSSSFLSLALLSSFSDKVKYRESVLAQVRAILSLSRKDFSSNRPEIEHLIGDVLPNTPLPTEVKNHTDLNYFLAKNLKSNQDYLEREQVNSVWPLFWYRGDSETSWLVFPTLLSWYNSVGANDKLFVSLPLISHYATDENSSSGMFLTPLTYMEWSKQEDKTTKSVKPYHSYRDKYGVFDRSNRHGLGFLFYYGQKTFNIVANDKIDANNVETLRSDLSSLISDKNSLQSNIEYNQKELKNIENSKVHSKQDEYRKLIRLERYKGWVENHKKALKNYEYKKERILLNSKALGIELDIAELNSSEECQEILNRLFAKYVIERKFSDCALIPLFWTRCDEDGNAFVLPALLSWYVKNVQESYFFSLPLLSYFSQEKDSSFASIASFVGWTQECQTRKLQNISLGNNFSTQSEFGAVGLYQYNRKSFYRAKDGIDGFDFNLLRKSIAKVIQNSDKTPQEFELAKKRLELEIKYSERVVDKYNKQIKLEDLKDRYSDASKIANREQVKEYSEKLNFKFEDKELESDQGCEELLKRLFAEKAELCIEERYGNGLLPYSFFNSNSGDYLNKLLWGTLLWSKEGENEYSHFLYLLYRNKKSAMQEETIFFPFVAIQEDKSCDHERFSFMWRLFQLNRERDNRYGYIFFIPFGKKQAVL